MANVLHITDDDNLQRVLNHFLNPKNKASATFVIATDGTVYQMVDLQLAPWTNGPYKDDVGNRCHRTDIPWLNKAIAAREEGSGPSLNDYCITYEIVGKPYRAPTEAQYETVIQLIDHYCTVYGMSRNRGHVMRHADIDRCRRWYCPGQRGVFDLARIIRRLGGDPTNLAD